MEETIIGILTFVIIFLIAFSTIKLIFKPIKTSTALLIYKFFRNASYGTGGTSNIYTSKNYSGTMPTNFELNEAEELKPKKPASRHTANFGETTYTDSTGNYVGQSVNNDHGQKIYTDANENITTSSTNYAGEETFDDGKATSSDSFGNKYYH